MPDVTKFPIPTLASIRRQLAREALLPPCPGVEAHTPDPRGYHAWHEWAAEMSRTHRQVRCSHCKLLAIWVPKPGVTHQRASGARRRLAAKYGVRSA